MEDRKALLFVENETIKIVFGSSLKCIKLSDVSSPVNVEFFRKLFAAATVCVISGLDSIDYQKFINQFPAAQAQAPSQPQQSALAQPQRKAAPPPLPKAPPLPPRQASATPAPAAKQKTTFIKSNAKNIIMIDDLPTGLVDHRGGKEVLTIYPGGAVNVANLDPQALRGSMILKKLLQNGTLAPCTPDEALQLNDAVFAKQQEFDDLALKQMTTVPGSGTTRARDMARDGLMMGGPGGEGTARGVEELDITSDVLRAGRSSGGDGIREGAGGGQRRVESMETLMELIQEDESMGPPPRRALEPRTPVSAPARPGAGANASRIRSDHQY